MSDGPHEHPPHPNNVSPGSLLDALRDHAEWSQSQRAEQFDRLVAGFEPEDLLRAARNRLPDLRGHEGEAVLRLIEAFETPEVLEELAEAIAAQPDLPAERAWHALGLLDEAGLLDAYPELAERWDELSEAMDDEGSLDELLEQIEDDPDEVWVALQGLVSVEPEVRVQILAGLANRPPGPGLVAFLRLLSYSQEPETRTAALDALASQDREDSRVIAAWAEIATDHFDPAVATRARGWLEQGSDSRPANSISPGRSGPRLIRSLVSALDGRGEGTIVLAAEDQGRWTSAAFLCDVRQGIREVLGQTGTERAVLNDVFAEAAAQPGRDAIEGADQLALDLLASALLLCGPQTTPALRFWLERTAGPGFRPRPFSTLIRDEAAALPPRQALPAQARAVLSACDDWVDDSPLTLELAEEIALREGDSPPDPKRDEAIYRYLFEHRLLGRLELYRRMLFWMASFWKAASDAGLSRAALTFASQLSDAQFAVPGHPFIQELITRSLVAAQGRLREKNA
jgi:hypothetical protein